MTYLLTPNSESNAILHVWKGSFADPKWWGRYKSSRVDKNESRANAFYRKAVDQDIEGMAEAGDQYAQVCLGWMQHCGDGVDLTYSTAVEWYRKAAEQSYSAVQYYLGVMYQHGDGVDQTESTAVEWYRKATEQGHADAQYSLDLLTESLQK